MKIGGKRDFFVVKAWILVNFCKTTNWHSANVQDGDTVARYFARSNGQAVKQHISSATTKMKIRQTWRTSEPRPDMHGEGEK